MNVSIEKLVHRWTIEEGEGEQTLYYTITTDEKVEIEEGQKIGEAIVNFMDDEYCLGEGKKEWFYKYDRENRVQFSRLEDVDGDEMEEKEGEEMFIADYFIYFNVYTELELDNEEEEFEGFDC